MDAKPAEEVEEVGAEEEEGQNADDIVNSQLPVRQQYFTVVYNNL